MSGISAGDERRTRAVRNLDAGARITGCLRGNEFAEEVVYRERVVIERLDERKTAGTDLTVLRMWLDQAWSLRSQEKYDDVHTVTDRCRAQADMIREKITASKLAAEADQKEAEVARARATLEKTKKALENAKVQKIRLEAKS